MTLDTAIYSNTGVDTRLMPASAMSQTVLFPQHWSLGASMGPDKTEFWLDPLLAPAYLASLSLLLLVVHGFVVLVLRIKRKSILSEFKQHVKLNGGAIIFAFKFVRLVACLALVTLSFLSVLVDVDNQEENHRLSFFKKKHRRHRDDGTYHDEFFTRDEWLQLSLLAFYSYTSVLALWALAAPLRVVPLVHRHLGILLLGALGVYSYRDLWPFATYNGSPADLTDKYLWWKIAVLTVGGAVVPLLIPNAYIPVDPSDPSTEQPPEQTACLLSFMFFSFLDPIVWLGYRSPHLAFESLPPLADYDRTSWLRKRALPNLDPFVSGKKRHAFWAFAHIFGNDYLILSVMISIRVLTSFASPVGVNRLLNYIETGGVDAEVRPWVWISWLFIGPLIGTIAMQWYIFVATRMLVRTEAIVTQVVFEHALRIRMKEETSSAPKSSTSTTVTTPDSASIVDLETSPPSERNSSSTLSAGSTVVASEASLPSSPKGKGKDKTPKAEDAATKEPKAANLVGKINNLITTDLNNITEARDFLFLLVYCPLQIVLCIWFLYKVLGWSSFVGLATMVASVPLPGWIANKINSVQTERMKKSDARVEDVTEMMGLLRMIKMFAWESKMNDRLREKREDELKWIRKSRILNLLNGNLNYIIPLMTMLATYATYTLVMKKDLTPSAVFSSMAVFEMLRDQLHITFFVIPTVVQAKVSLDRLTEYLNKTELLDRYSTPKDTQINIPPPDVDEQVIGFHDATFRWANQPADGTLTPGRRDFKLRIEGSLHFKRNAINLVVGPTGCGKTSLLLALFGELHFEPAGPHSWYNLPREGGVAFAAQESWVQNETIRDNILFGAPLDEERYKKVLHQCALERDLSLFEAGDRTEVGEKGLTLSGGQKARITLARAIYSSAQVLLLDDVLSALDVHTSRWIIENCFKGELIQGRTVILVTHNVGLTSSIAQFVVSLGLDGRVVSQGSASEALMKDRTLLLQAENDQEINEKEAEVVDAPAPDTPADGKLIVPEEVALGHISWPALKLYLFSLGGVIFWALFLVGMFSTESLVIGQTWWLGHWASQYEGINHPAVNVLYYLAVYAGILLTGMLIYSTAAAIFVFGSLRASRTIHNRLIDAILGTTLRWLDTVPTSRVVARTTQDLRAVDGPINGLLSDLCELTIALVCRFGAVVISSPVFIFPGLGIGAIGWWCGQLYIASQLSVKREMSNSRSPVLGHFGAAIAGLTSIRAYGAEASFTLESMKRIDKYTRAARTFYNLNRWITIRVDALGGLFAAGLGAYLIYGPNRSSASETGFSLLMAVAFSGMILWWVRVLNEFEVSGNSLERIQDYIEIEQEPKPTKDGTPPAYWPASGNLRVEKLNAQYSKDGPKVLHDISFEIKSGERVGVVGRTGSGKSSLTLSLLRCIVTSGHIYYDGLATESMNLDALRSNMTIIPQKPELLSGSLRQNLDPFDEHDDATLNAALRSAGLDNLQQDTEEGRITLDTPISSSGGNLSLGQRQIIALARAIARRSKILILDEATAAVDYATDSAIQNSIRTELKDVTLITVAHRLRTIMDADKIMVLDEGKLVEFDAPKNLLEKKTGLLRSLVDESADRDELIAMANGASSSPQTEHL